MRMHKKVGFRFVVNMSACTVSDTERYIPLNEIFAMDLTILDSLNNFKMWESVVGAANELQKIIFVVRGSGEHDITGYGGNLVRFTASWADVMSALQDKSGVCCFTAASTDVDDFEVTHVVVPVCQKTFMYGGGDTQQTEQIECPYCTLSPFEVNEALRSEDERSTYYYITLEEADLLPWNQQNSDEYSTGSEDLDNNSPFR